MALRTSSLARFKGLLEVDPDSLESILPRTRSVEDDSGVPLAAADWERLIQILKGGLDRLGEPDLRLLAVEHVAEIYEQRLGDIERVVRWWGQVLGTYGFVERATEELERLARATGAWRVLVQVYTTASARLGEAARRQVQLRLARIHLEELEEADRAERILQGLWQKEHADEALHALQRLYERTGRKDQLAGLLRHQIAEADTVEHRIELLLQLGFLYEVELTSPDLALDAYREVLKLDPLNQVATEALEQIYLRHERWPELLAIYEGLAAGASSDEDRTQHLVRMARICDDILTERARSRELWQRVRELRPDDRTLLEEMARRFEVAERWEELSEVMARQAALSSGAARARILERQGRIFGDRLGDRTRAIACWQEVLELEPENVVALLALSDLCGQAEAWHDLAGVLRRLIEVGEREGRDAAFLVPLHTALARLEERSLCRPEQAIESWRRVLALEPRSEAALDTLDRLLAAELRWAECIDVLERRVELAPSPEEVVPLLLRQALLLRDGIGDIEATVRAFERVLDRSPVEQQAHEGLCGIYREHGRWEELCEQIFVWLEVVSDSRQALKLLHEAAVVFEVHLDQPEKAFVVWQSALKQDPENQVTTSNLERLAGSLQRLEELLQVYDQAVQATASARIKLKLLVAMGRCRGLELGQLDQAVALLHEALHLDPEAIPALEVLEEIYRRTCRWPELMSIVRRHAELERDADLLVPLLCTLGELQSHLGAADQALLTYRKVLELSPAQPEALLALEGLYLAFGAWAELAEVLQRQLELGLAPERRVSSLVQLAELYEQQLGNPARAIACYREALSLEPNRLDVMHALERLYDQGGESEAYLDMVERQLDLSDDVEQRVTMFERIAGAWEEQLGRKDRAIVCWEKLLGVDRRHQSAHKNLERLAIELNDLPALAQVLRRHADAVEPEERVGLLLELGTVIGDMLRALPAAVDVYQEILELAPREVRALEALASLHEKQAQWPEAASALSHLVPLLQGEQRAAALLRLARIREGGMQQPDEAERSYEQALAADEGCFDAMLRLSEIYRAREDWVRAAAMMVRAEPHTGNLPRKAQLLYDAGMIRLERLGDEAGAAELLARTLEADPDHMSAGLPLSILYERAGRLAELEPVLDMLARKVDARDRPGRLEVCFRLARTAAALGKTEKAIRFYLEARTYDLNHLPTLRALAELQYQTGDWQETFKTLQTILIHHRERLDTAEVAEVFFRLGSTKEQQSELRKALGYYEKALEQVPAHRASLEATVRIQTQLEAWDAVVRAKTRLVPVADPDERPRLLQECAELHLEKLNNAQAALDAYHAAVSLKPDDRGLLLRFLDLLSERRRWPEALQVLMRLTELETVPEIRARYFYTAAAICRDELDDADRALQLFNEALDCAPDHLKAFEAIDRLCTARKDWQSLVIAYRRMIARQQADEAASLRAMLWHNLGEVYRTRLRQIPEAIRAFESASGLEPQNLQRHEILAELYQLAGGEHAPRAIAEHRTLLADDPRRLASYSALAHLYGLLGQRDAQYCICAALTLIGGGSPEEQELHQRHRHKHLRRGRGRVSDELWSRCIRHPAQDPRVDALLIALAPLLTELGARPAKDFGLKRKHRARATDPVGEIFHYVTSVLGALAADLYEMRDQAVPLMVANTVKGPSVVVGAPLLAALTEGELAFTMGQQLTYLRPGYFLCRLFPSPSQLRLVLAAAMKLVAPALPLEPAEAVEAAKLTEQLSTVVPAHATLMQDLAAYARPFVEGRERLDLTHWWNAITRTADRAGLILCGDLHTAAGIIQQAPAPFGTIPAAERVRELVAYAISEEHFQVRQSLGIAIS